MPAHIRLPVGVDSARGQLGLGGVTIVESAPIGTSSTDPRQLADFDWRARYSTGRNDLYSDFYSPAMARSAYYDRAVGYFRSTVFNLTGVAVAQFALRGGHIRLVCSPDMSMTDVQAIDQALSIRDQAERAMLRKPS